MSNLIAVRLTHFFHQLFLLIFGFVSMLLSANMIWLLMLFIQGHGSDVDYINPTKVSIGENMKAVQVSCGFNHTGAIFEYT